MASPAAPLLTVMDISQVIAKAHIPQSDAALLHKGDKATLSISGADTKMNGTVTLVSPALDPNSTTVEIWVQAANPDQQLRPGMTTQLAITAQTIHDAVVVPTAALLNANGSEAQVMVIDGQSVAQSRDVKLGIQGPQEAQIVSGLKPGEMVINEGAYGLPDKTKVKIEQPETGEKKPQPAEKKKSTGKADD
jgi:HlyD family secretion protein